MKPTEAQIKEFWEWCGFKYKYSETYQEHRWYYPDHKRGKPYIVDFRKELPSIDLNNLFKYAVPSVNKIIKGRRWIKGIRFRLMDGGVSCVLDTAVVEFEGDKKRKAGALLSQSSNDPLVTISKDDKDPALALFWALWKVKEEK